MIKLETAQALKDAGLEWEPKWGDYFVIPEVFADGISMLMDFGLIESYKANDPKDNWEDALKKYIWLPRLDQLLAEVEGRGFIWELIIDRDWNGREYTAKGYCFYIKNKNMIFREFKADSPEEAAAQALLWILQQAG